MTKRIVLTHWWNEHRARGLTTLFPQDSLLRGGHIAHLSNHSAGGTQQGVCAVTSCVLCSRLGRIRESYGDLASTHLLAGCREWSVELMTIYDCAWDQLGADPVMASRG
jgi:hypothetical protein